MWDTYLSEEDLNFEEIHVNVCAGFLHEFSPSLRLMEYEELFQSIQRLPTQEWGDAEVEMLLSQADLWRMMKDEKNHEIEEEGKLEKDLDEDTFNMSVMYDTDTILFL